jgi:hypothetical protein
MEYKHVNGQAYCRYAVTPPILNSPLALQYGIEAPSMLVLEEGRNVKLRIVMEGRQTRMTCHARVDYVKPDETTGQYKVGFSNLSLTEGEFRLLLQSFVPKSERVLEFGDTVRDKGVQAEPVTAVEGIGEICRMKAVTLPVSVIEDIDMKRGDVSFSDFVVKALRSYLKR